MKLENIILTCVLLVTVMVLHQATLVVAPESFRKLASIGSVNSMKKYPELSYNHFMCHKWRDMNSMDFVIEQGDVIACLLSSPLGSIVRIPHWLMAINDRELIHVSNPVTTNYVGAVEIVKKSEQKMGYNTKRCLNLGNGGFDTKAAFERSHRWWRHVLWYHGVWCSCQHWVFYWVTGEPGGSFANFPHFPVSSKCQLSGLSPDYDPGDPFRLKVSYKLKKGLYHWNGVREATEEEYKENVRLFGGKLERAVTGISSGVSMDSEDVDPNPSSKSAVLSRNVGRRSGLHNYA